MSSTAAPWPKGVAVTHANKNGDATAASYFAFVSGAIAALSFTVVYVVAPLSLLGIPALVIAYPYWWLSWALAAPLIASAILPPIPSRSFLQAWPFKHMPAYVSVWLPTLFY